MFRTCFPVWWLPWRVSNPSSATTYTYSNVEFPAIAAPTEPTGTNFDFNARTDNFAAVNAYYHCDKFFRLLDGMGFTRAGYFGGTTFLAPWTIAGT